MKKKVKKVLDFLLYCGLGSEFYVKYDEEIQRQNESAVHTISGCATILMIGFTLASIVFKLPENIPVLVAFTAVMFIFTLRYELRRGRRDSKYINGSMQSFMWLSGLYFLLVQYYSPGDIIVFLPMIIVLFAVVFTVKPVQMMIYQSGITFGFLLVTMLSEADAHSVICNCVNYGIGLFLAIVIGHTNTTSKLHWLAANIERDNFRVKEIAYANKLANQDPLTGVRSRVLYERERTEIAGWIQNSEGRCEFAVVECDTNNLKEINDELGHEEGDRLLVSYVREICEICRKSKVFRIGGDEIVVILTGEDYRDRYRIYEELQRAGARDCYTFATGMAVYDPSHHKTFNDVFRDADKDMFKHKSYQKSQRTENWFEESILARRKAIV